MGATTEAQAAAPAAAGAPTSRGLDLSGLSLELQRKTRLGGVDAGLARRARNEQEQRRFSRRVTIAWTLGSIVFFFVGTIWAQRDKFEREFAWWDRARGGAAPEGARRFSLYQVAIASFYTSVQERLNALTVWTELSQQGALFLLKAVAHFEQRERTAGALTLLHWAGSAQQLGADRLFAPRGAWLLPCGDLAATGADRRRQLRDNWIASRDENPWFLFLPDPRADDDGRAFFSVPVIEEVLTADPCGPVAQMGIFHLFDGGLCGVAARDQNASALQLFRRYFGANVTVAPTCYGLAEAAVAGAATAGSMSAAFGETIEYAGAGRLGGLGARQARVGLATVGATLVGGLAGSQFAEARRQEQCDNRRAAEVNRRTGVA